MWVWILSQILKSLLRIESKLDAILMNMKRKDPLLTFPPMSWKGQIDPVSQQKVEYVSVILDPRSPPVIIRKCGLEPGETRAPIGTDEIPPMDVRKP